MHSLEIYTIQERLHNNQADYAVVIAGEFSGGKVIRHEEENGIVLIDVPLLVSWVMLHSETPVNSVFYREMFTSA